MAAVLVNSCLIRPSALSATFSNSPSLKTLVIRCAMRSVGYPTPATALAIDAYLAVQYAHSVKTFSPSAILMFGSAITFNSGCRP